MRLNEINDNAGARKLRVRIGRGIGSGVGKQGGRGGKGQTARTGVAIGGFEGGQMPLHRRLPKRGFNKWRRKDYNEISLGALQKAVDAGKLKSGQDVTSAALVEAGMLRRSKDGVRLLGSGELKAKLVADRRSCDGVGKGSRRKGRRLDQADREESSRGRRGQAQEDRRQEGGQGWKQAGSRQSSRLIWSRKAGCGLTAAPCCRCHA